jgi:type IV secretory pathway VirB4 component
MLNKLKKMFKPRTNVKIYKNPSKKNINDAGLVEMGMKTNRDFLAPHPIDFKPGTYRKVGDFYTKTLFMWKWPSKLSNNHLDDLYNLQIDSTITMHQIPVDTNYFVSFLTKRINQNLKTQKANEDRKRSDGRINYQIKQDEELRDKLISGEENAYVIGFYIDIHADSLDELNKRVDKMQRAVGRKGFTAYNSDGQNEDAFYTTLPILTDRLQRYQDLTTSNVVDIFPLSSAHLSMDGGVYYGKNKGDNSIILLDRFKMKNPNMAIIAPSGSGKSVFTKQEHFLYWLLEDAKVYAIDRENEMRPLTELVGGLYLDYSKKSNFRMNPCDLRYSEDDKFDYFDRKIEFLINLFRKMAGQLSTMERSLLARSIRKAYEEKGFTEDYQTLYEDYQASASGNIQIKNKKLRPLSDMPILSDIDMQMEMYTELADLRARVSYFLEEGPGRILNAHSTVDITEYDWVTFGVRNLSKETRPVIIWTVLDFIENTIKHNADLPKHLREKLMVLAEEAWSIINNDEEAEYFYEYSKRCRKYGGALTTVVQSILDYYKDSKGNGAEILNNTSMVVLLPIGEKAVGAKELKEKLSLSEKVIRDLKRGDTGQGYIITDENRAEFQLEIIPEIKEFITTSAFEEQATYA